MLITFKSKVGSKVTLFGDVAKKLISMMGITKGVPGAIKAEKVPAALKNLQHHIELSKQQNENDSEADISIALRAAPLINLLKAAITANSYVMWE